MPVAVPQGSGRDIVHVEHSAGLFGADAFLGQREDGALRDHEHAAQLGKPRDQIVAEAAGERQLALPSRFQIDERHDGDRRTARPGRLALTGRDGLGGNDVDLAAGFGQPLRLNALLRSRGRALIDRGGRWIWLGLQLPPQGVGQGAIIPDGVVAQPLLDLQRHQAATGLFRQGIEPDRAVERRHGGIPVARRRLRIGQRQERAERHSLQPVALFDQPVLEPGLPQAEAVQERTAIEIERRAQLARHRRQPAELEHVAFDGVGAQRHGLAFDQQQRVRLAQLLAQRQQRLAEAVPRLLVAAVAPQQGRQPVARLFLSGVAGEIGEQGFRLARGESHVPPVGPPDAKAPQQCQLD